MSGYTLGIDLGTTFTAAAIDRDGRIEIVTLGNRSAVMPSSVYLREDDELLIGEAASRRAIEQPRRYAREFKRRVGDETPIMLDRSPFSAERLMAIVLRNVLEQVHKVEGTDPQGVTLTHPANWGPFKIEALRQAAVLAGQPAATLLSEPEAAALHYASVERIDEGAAVAVYDLGGGTFDAAVLRRTASGFETLGTPSGIERLGGIDFDAAVFEHVRQSIADDFSNLDQNDDAVMSALSSLRQECADAKEALSADVDASIRVALPSLTTVVRITRSEFEDAIRPLLRETIESLRRAIHSAGLQASELASVLLVGGSSRIPLVAEMVAQELGRPVAVDAHPKHVVALGAALFSRGQKQLAPVVDPVGPASTDSADSDSAGPAVPGSPDTRRKVPVVAIVALILVAVGAAAFVLLSGDDPTGEAGDTIDDAALAADSDTATPTTEPIVVTTTEPAIVTTTELVTTTTTDPITTTTTTTVPVDEDCAVAQTLEQWVCFESVSLESGVYVITYSGEFGGETLNTSSGIHLHVFGNHVAPENAGGQATGHPSTWRVVDSIGEIRVEVDAPDVFDGTDTKICAVVADARGSRVGSPHFYYDDEGGNCLTLPVG